MVFNTEKKKDELLSKNYNENAKNIKWDDIKRSKKPYELLGKIQELSARNTLLYIKQQQEKMTKEIKLETQELEKSKIEETKAQKEVDEVKDAVKFTADFYKEVFKVYGEKAEKLAKEFEKQAKGKKIRNANDALKAYEKQKANINKKINAKDRKAIASALESVKAADIAKNFERFSKGMGYVGPAIDGYELFFVELPKAIKSDNWRPFFVKAETMGAGVAATALTAFAFSALAINPIGLIGYALIMAVVSAMIDESLMEGINKLVGI